MTDKIPRLRPIWIVVSATVAICGILWGIRSCLQDRPIPGGIVAYRSHNLKGMRYTHCSCGHKGFYILADGLVLWYVTDHDSLQPEGKIVASDGNKLTIQPVEEPFEGEDPTEPYTIEKHERKIHVVRPATEYLPVEEFTLKLTYLGPQIRERVEKFDFEEWNASRDKQ